MGSILQIKDYLLEEISPSIWRLEKREQMNAGVHFVGSENILRALHDDKSIEQAVNVACLPGVVDPVLTMPDIHQGYGFPIGGVAAFFIDSGVISPGGVGYDINCGVRLLKTNLLHEEISTPKIIQPLLQDIFEAIPTGVGSQREDLNFNTTQFTNILMTGAQEAIRMGFGLSEDVLNIEKQGMMKDAHPEYLSSRARERGLFQLGTLGSGNHFLEVQFVDRIFDERTAEAFGLFVNQIVITIHTGSRGLGYQVCQDALETCLSACKKYGISLRDPELASAPLDSPEGINYLGAMRSAANFAFANRQFITHWTREVFSKHFSHSKLDVLYDVCHNIAQIETMPWQGTTKEFCIHRKGATRAYPPGHRDLAPHLRPWGQPVIIPGDMGRYSFVLCGNPHSMELSFGSACHGAGRILSRHQAKKRSSDRAVENELAKKGIYVKSSGRHTVVEEMPEAYKDVSEVVDSTSEAGIAHKVARLRPILVIKG